MNSHPHSKGICNEMDELNYPSQQRLRMRMDDHTYKQSHRDITSSPLHHTHARNHPTEATDKHAHIRNHPTKAIDKHTHARNHPTKAINKQINDNKTALSNPARRS